MTQTVQETRAARAVQRRYERIGLPKGMLVAWQHMGGRGVSRVATLGLGGLFISTADPAPMGTLVKLIFDVPDGEVRARGIVKDVKPAKGMAVAFIQMEQADRARLDQLLRVLLRLKNAGIPSKSRSPMRQLPVLKLLLGTDACLV